MSRLFAVMALSLVSISLVSNLALAQPCANGGAFGLSDGPIRIGMYSADLGTGHRACPRSEFALYARGAIAIDLPGFYGNVGIGTLLSISHVIKDRVEIFGTVQILDWQFAQNAVLKGSELRFGQTTLGAMMPLLRSERVTVSPYARIMLPTAGPETNVLTFGGEVGAAVNAVVHQRIVLHGFLGYDGSVGVSIAPPVSRNGASLSIGAQFLPKRWFAVALDLATHYGNRAAVDYIAPQLALRFAAWRGLGIELSGLYNVYGADKKNVLMSLHLTWRY